MSVALTTCQGKPALEIAASNGELHVYLWRRQAAGYVLTCLDPETGEPACDRSGRERTYSVRQVEGRLVCDCPHWLYRCRKVAGGEPGCDCKHIEHVRELDALLTALGATTSAAPAMAS